MYKRQGQSRPAAQPDPELLTVGDLTLDTRQRVAIRDGKAIDLTAKEYDLVELLMKNPRRVYSRESLMDLVWGYSYAGDYRTVDVHIRRLRETVSYTHLNAKPATCTEDGYTGDTVCAACGKVLAKGEVCLLYTSKLESFATKCGSP